VKIVVVDQNLPAVRAELEAGLPAGAEVVWHRAYDEDAVRADLAGAAVLVSSRYTRGLREAAGSLRLLQAPSAGVDGIAFDAVPEGVAVANTFHHEGSMAEQVVASTVVLRRGLVRLDAELRRGRWASSTYDPDQAQPSSLEGARVGFVGFGHIGTATWRLFRAFGASGAAVTGSGSTDAAAHGLAWAGTTAADLDRLLGESDVVVVSAPLTAATRGMVGSEQLARMRPDAVLVNVGRGPLVDEHALYGALATRAIGGAVLDVWWRYPRAGAEGEPSSQPFGDLDNVLLTPHSSGVTRQTFLARARDVAENVRRLGAGEPPVNPVPRP